MVATPSKISDEPRENSGLLESGGYLALTPREGAPDFNTAFTLEYDAELEEYTLRYPSRLRPGTPQNVAAEDARRLLDESPSEGDREEHRAARG